MDFHTHFVPEGFARSRPPGLAIAKELEEALAALTDFKRLNDSIGEQDINRRVINTPLEMVATKRGEERSELCRRINDSLAEICANSGGRLLALASIDAYAGDKGAAELRRAVSELGLLGAFVESASGNRLISAQQARPTLAAAAELGVGVFVHPVQEMTTAIKYGLSSFYQINLARASINSVALADMLEAGVFDELPALRVCFTTLALSAILFGGLIKTTRPDASDILRRQVYVDTIGVNATLIRATADVLGLEHILLGTDWPILSGYSIRSRLIQAAADCGMDTNQRSLVASGNARRFLGLN